MALPFILSLLGSGLAGAGALGTGLLASPLIAGAVGAGLGKTFETGDLGEGIKTGLTAGLLGGIGGALVGGGAAAPAAGGAVVPAAAGAAPAGVLGSGATSFRQALGAMPSGTAAVAAGPNLAFRDVVRQGLNQGVLTGAGLGTALPGLMEASQPKPMEVPEPKDIPEAEPFYRELLRPPENYRPGIDPEFVYFSPTNYGTRRMTEGGMLKYQSSVMDAPMYMQAGGIADMMPGIEVVDDEMMLPQMNDKDIVKASVSAIRGEIPEEEAAIVLGMFLQSFGEEALRRLVSDVQSGKVDGERGDIEGMIEGPGDGMDDLVPAEMDDGSQDVLLSDGEFIVPADVVSGLGNGSTDAGAEELYNMMDRVREERTGMTEQPAQVKIGGLLPA
jgi:hypothetical protein